MVNRLHTPTSGSILVNDTPIQSMDVIALRRSIGYVIQQTGLFPHLTVAQNIAVVPELLGWERRRIQQRVDELLDLVALPPADYRHRRPSELSGGQQQRVGIARALAADPPIILMDEPFGALDALTRATLQDELRRLQQHLRKTILFVTHDVDEALLLANCMVVMNQGRIVQYDTPHVLLTRPATPFVHDLLGGDDPTRLLALVPITALMQPLPTTVPAAPRIPAHVNGRTALALLLRGTAPLLVVEDHGQPVGTLTLPDLQNAASVVLPA